MNELGALPQPPSIKKNRSVEKKLSKPCKGKSNTLNNSFKPQRGKKKWGFKTLKTIVSNPDGIKAYFIGQIIPPPA